MVGMVNSLMWFLLGSLVCATALLIAFCKRRQSSFRISSRSLHGLVGTYGVMATDIEPNCPFAKVEVHGTLWNAEAFEPIPKGTRVIIAAQDNLNLTVQRAD